MNLYDGNMAILGSMAVMAAAALLLVIGGYVAIAAIWRLRREPASLSVMLARHGLDWGRLAAVGSIGEVATALDRCVECHAKTQCEEWLASGRRDGYASFCPNATFVERMKGAVQR